MIGRLPKIRRRRDRGQDKPAGAQDSAPTAEQPPIVAGPPAPAGPPAAPLPADVPPAAGDTQHQPSFRDRGRFRRRLRYLRRVRELGFRDLGGLVFDQHRFGRAGDELVGGKLTALAAVDRELRALERALDDRRTFIDLREPGIAACPRCAALHGSDARFCPSCGMRLSGPLAVAEVGEGAVGGAPPAMAPAPPAPADGAPAAAAATRTTVRTTTAAAATQPGAGEPAAAHAPPFGGASPPADRSTAAEANTTDVPGEDQPTSAWMPSPGDAGAEPAGSEPADGRPADAEPAPADRREA